MPPPVPPRAGHGAAGGRRKNSVFPCRPLLVAALLAAVLLVPSCVSKNEFEHMKEEIAAVKGDLEKIRNLATVVATDQKKIEADVESLGQEISELRAAAAAQPEKAQNKASGAKPKKKKKKK
jgi:septal ring factor EnvC (AmiA/AmiB activator)